MDHGSFDKVARLFGSAGSRRAALGALLGTGLAGAVGAADAEKKDRNRKRRNGQKNKGAAQVSAQAADCLSPGPSTNISDCDYTNDNFSGDDLSSSRMVRTIFRNADMVKTNLHSVNAKDAIFRDADLCGADMRSSAFGGANFRDADLTRANLKSSGGCNSATFTAGTTFCNTTMCDGSVRNDDCLVAPFGTCCVDADCIVAGTVCDEPANRCCAQSGVFIGGNPDIACCPGLQKCADAVCRASCILGG